MNSLFLNWIFSTLMVLVLIILGLAEGRTAPKEQPVVLELFTSQGCSSCPPADRLLIDLAGESDIADIIPLSFHVDYWDYLGWKDPYSSGEWSDRQADYAGAFGASSLYTPQMVIQGLEQAIGSNKEQVLSAIRSVSKKPRLDIQARVIRSNVNEVVVESTLENTPGVDLNASEYVLILFQKNQRTEVNRGENAGRSLENKFIVQKIEKEDLDGDKVTISLKYRGLDLSEKHGLVVLVQDQLSREIYGSTRVKGK